MNINNKTIVVSVISDLVTDQRVHKVCTFLAERGARVMLIGRAFSTSLPVEQRAYTSIRLHCIFKKGVLQYLEFNLRLFIRLWFHRPDLLVANDLDTLLPNFIHSRLRKKPLVYDSHEYFTGVPELRSKPLKRKIWKSLEAFLLPRIQHAYTVNDAIREQYAKEYGISMRVVRNMPVLKPCLPCPDEYRLPDDKIILIMQGSGINPERGYEEAVAAMELLSDEYLLVIIGSGTIWNELKTQAGRQVSGHRIRFIDRVPFEVLSCYTRQAALGLSLDKPLSENYRLSLPNKVFDYIHAGVPVLGSDIAAVRHIIDEYAVGWVVPEVSPEAIAASIKQIMTDQEGYHKIRSNTHTAAAVLHWETEEKILEEIYNEI